MSDILTTAARDRTLPAKALGVLAHMIHAPDTSGSYTAIADARPDGHTAIRKAVLTLEEHGYLTRTIQRDAAGKMAGATYTLHNPKERA